ncbi:MAG: PAS domain-containing protein [Verrucomicrobia bacterium]|nr:PAS domain-containing protein [Verrucomicrobiota bacterium]
MKTRKSAPRTPPSSRPNTPKRPKDGFPIVGIGASAGGLEAFELFFRRVPPKSGMAFVLVPHLDPAHASMLTEILQRSTAMPVVEAQDQMTVEPDHVFIIPPNRDMALFHGALHLSVPEASRGQRMPIDFFLRSLAEDVGEKAIGVILSGTGTDGTLGLRAIHGAGGVCFVQEPSTAKYDGMPASAIQTGLATFVLPPDKMPEQLEAYVGSLFGKKVKPVPAADPATAGAMSKVLRLLRSKTGHDFSAYKQSTIGRRIERRMTIHGIQTPDIYIRFLQEHPHEIRLLFKELLINVTSFFRDPDAFASLKTDVLPVLFKGRPENYVFRVWVPGCATGEEAYSIAMLFREQMDEIKQEFKVQIYGTDLDEDAISIARAGHYPPNIAQDVTPERLRRFFIHEDSGYRVKKDIREMVVFAVQNAIKDPPFTRLDLLSCRNLLIYLEPELQHRLITAFHYALKPGGALFLSPSESIGSHPDLFSPLSKKWKLYQARASIVSTRMLMAEAPAVGVPAGKRPDEPGRKPRETNFAELTRRVLLQSYAPPSVVTDDKGNILFVHGDTGKYLRPAPGQASLNVIEMAREGLALELRTALHAAATQKKRVLCRTLPVKTNGGVHNVNLTVTPLTDPETAQGMLLVSFQDVEPPPRGKAARAKGPATPAQTRRVEELEKELLYTKETLQANIEEMQASNEEIKSTNEELQSTNEELQSTNEELETSKEELQSVNEELVTVNTELQAKIEQLAGMQNDMKNLLDNTNIGTIFLNRDLAIKRFTREAATIFRLLPADAGRPLADIKSNLEGEDLVADARAVLDSLVPREREIAAGRTWYLARIMPYRTLENAIDGVVLTFTDITHLRAASTARDFAENIVNTVREPLMVLDAAFKVVSASHSFYETFRASERDTVGHSLYEIGNRQWNIPRLRELLETVLPKNTFFEDFVVEHEFPKLGRRKMLLNARRIPGKAGETQLILLAMEDVTERAPAAVAAEVTRRGRRTK